MKFFFIFFAASQELISSLDRLLEARTQLETVKQPATRALIDATWLAMELSDGAASLPFNGRILEAAGEQVNQH
jgi:hypothetical protein